MNRALPPGLSLTLALATFPSIARADGGLVANPGLIGLLLTHRSSDPRATDVALAGGAGVEFSLVRYERALRNDAFLYGGVAQVAGVSRNNAATFYGMLGGEVAYGGLGVELGAYVWTAGGGGPTSVGLHLAPYLSLGFVYVSAGLHVPFAQGDASVPDVPHFALTTGLKAPLTLTGSPLSFGGMPSGRPLVHDGRLVVADTATNDLWTDDVSPEVNPLDEVTRRALAAQWLDDGLAEHASIAAFTRVATQLLAVGAPPELLEGAHRAALDEVRHARLCFTLAGMYGGAWKAPGAIDVGAIRDARCDLASIAREALVEGCLGEGTAAALAASASERCDDPEVKRCLAAIADDEARHEALAWRILMWCLDRGGDDVGDAVAQALRAMPATVPLFDLPRGVDRAVWSASGRALPEEAAATHATVAAGVSSRAWQHPKMASRVSAVTPRRSGPRSRR